ncbi:hypothetical protein MASR2M48_31050 [Spirochaetota bacterium]
MRAEELYASRIFLNAALPLLKVVATEKESVKRGFSGKNGTVQVSALTGADADAYGAPKIGTHFFVEDGLLRFGTGLCDKPDLELAFQSIASLNGFFSGRSKKLPTIKGGLRHLASSWPHSRPLLAMASALGVKSAPASEAERAMIVRMFFYLLSSGISQLNKAGHPAVAGWAKKSPDRVYAWSVEGKPNCPATSASRQAIADRLGRIRACQAILYDELRLNGECARHPTVYRRHDRGYEGRTHHHEGRP